LLQLQAEPGYTSSRHMPAKPCGNLLPQIG
jgi:hypothetical protein